MSHFDDYEDEMGFLARISDRELDGLFGGKASAGHGDAEDLAAHLAAAKATYVGRPSEALEARHLAAIAGEAQLLAEQGQATLEVDRPARQMSGSSKRRWVMGRGKVRAIRVAAGAVATALSMFGLAYALDLPDEANEEAKARVTLPEQAQGGNAVSEFATTSELEGCEFGLAVAQFATETFGADDAQIPAPEDACEQADARARGSRATGAEKSEQGLSTADGASGGRSSAGLSTGEDATSTGGSTAGTATSTGQSTGGSVSGDATTSGTAGQSTGNDAAEEGQDNNPTGEGRP